ncbi:anti-sigma factor family protein [Kiloniella sp.]|uniref:anti-sigma factor family protein n=1 Tax=Kiloniella sp. TaxID=1938587 RepID=UPI003B01B0E2
MSKERFEGSELLHAYVDGELNASEKARVEQWLDTHPEDAKRVKEWQKQNEGLQTLFASKANETVPSHLLPSGPPKASAHLNSSTSSSSTLSRIAAALIFLVIGSAGGWFGHGYFKGSMQPSELTNTVSRTLTTPAMEAHWVYTPEVRHPVEVDSDEQVHLAKWLSFRLDSPLSIPDLSSSGFELMGGRLLPSKTGPAAQFMYESKEGSRVTIYLSRSAVTTPISAPKTEEIAFQYQKSGATRAFYWYEGSLGYAVIGDIEHEELSLIANSVYQQL